tara:strand:- start:1141 stop:1593 length:453 start_codon:yes stop_codon:yes gene_type:complete
MYAVLSLLRRAAVASIYVQFEQAKDGILIEKPRDTLDLSTCRWSKSESVQMFVLTVVAPTSGEASVRLAKKENDIFHQAGLESKYYTLLLGPEEETQEGDTVIRSSRLGLVRGVFRSPNYLTIEPAKRSTAPVKRRSRRKLPAGVILEER